MSYPPPPQKLGGRLFISPLLILFALSTGVLGVLGEHCTLPAIAKDCPAKSAEKKMVLTQMPVTIIVKLSSKLRAEIDKSLGKDGGFEVRLAIEEVSRGPNLADLKGVRVFCNKPDSDLNTSIDDLHYVGSFVVPHVGPKSQKAEAAGGYFLSLTPTLRSLQKVGQLRLDQPVMITLIGVPKRDAALKVDATYFEFNRVDITAVAAKQ